MFFFSFYIYLLIVYFFVYVFIYIYIFYYNMTYSISFILQYGFESVQLKRDICEFGKAVWKKRNRGKVFDCWNIFSLNGMFLILTCIC